MVKLFPLNIITAMKLNCMRITQAHLNKAIEDGHEFQIACCRKELEELKYDAMHPQEVLESVQKYLLPGNCGNNIIQRPHIDQADKLA